MPSLFNHTYRTLVGPEAEETVAHWCPKCETEVAVPESQEPPRCCGEAMEAI